jgi:mono/diheme cytochrome c family protein
MRRALPALLALAAACGPSDPAAPGRELYARRGCAACHRVGAEGGIDGPDLSAVGLRRSREWLRLQLEDPAALKPDAAMPPAGLDPAEREAVAEYLLTLRGQHRPPLPADGRLGPELYERMGCAACHGRGGAGGGPANDPRAPGSRPKGLRRLARRFDKPSLARRLLRERPDEHGERVMPSLSSQLTPAELDALSAYLLTL